MDAITLMLWLQMHIVVALNLLGNVVVNIFFWLFCKVILVGDLNLFLLATLGC